jgi:single-stranded-DNA-specific exonuclease
LDVARGRWFVVFDYVLEATTYTPTYGTITFAMPKVWKILHEDPKDLVDQLLINRGIKTPQQHEQFFNPTIDHFSKELDIPGIAKAKKRIEKAIKGGEQIIVYGDYDVDGVSATAIMYHALALRGAKVLPYIPHREKEGYGLSHIGLDSAKASEATLIVTVDTGIVALEQALYAKTLGIDLVITDHHVALDNLPECAAIVHSTEMCGAAVAWCLAKALLPEDQAYNLLQFAALGSICDMMPMVGVSRFFAKEGLKILNCTDCVGLLSLMQECGIAPGSITPYHISHIIGPRINAMGRMEHAIDSLRLLCTKSPAKARELAHLLCETNDQKKQLTIDAIDQARLTVGKDIEVLKTKKILIVHSPEWIPGIIGLVAARLSEEYKMPAIAIAEGELESKGSARTVNGLNIVETLRMVSDTLIDVGGHPAAAGFTLQTVHIDAFKNKLYEVLEKVEMHELPELTIEASLPTKKVNKSLGYKLEEFEPTGVANQKPILATKTMMVSDVRTLSDGKHLKFKAEGIDAIAFGMGQMSDIIKEGSIVDVAYYLEINRFNGAENVQLKVVDLQVN